MADDHFGGKKTQQQQQNKHLVVAIRKTVVDPWRKKTTKNKETKKWNRYFIKDNDVGEKYLNY